MSTFRARTPSDLLALAPILLGFTPHESVVLLTFEPRGAAHLRFDIDGIEKSLASYLDTGLVGTRVALLIYTEDLDRAHDATVATLAHLDPTEPISVLAADHATWRPWLGDHYPLDGASYDNTTHPFTLQAHFDGRTIHPSRDALAETLTGDTAAVDAELDAAYGHVEQLLGGGNPRWVEAHAAWATDRVAAWVAADTQPPATDLALLAVTMQFTEVRDALFAAVDTSAAGVHLPTLLRIAAHTPVHLSAPARCLAAWVAILEGNGPLARLQLDLARVAHPDYQLIDQLEADLLSGPTAAAQRTDPPT